jgi:hypothetical protein
MSRRASQPLRQLTEEEAKELQRVSRASSEPRIRHQRAVALLAVAEEKSLSEAARLAGWKSHDPVTRLTRRFNTMEFLGFLFSQRTQRGGCSTGHGWSPSRLFVEHRTFLQDLATDLLYSCRLISFTFVTWPQPSRY